MNDLSIIIVSWNCVEYLRQCLESVRTHPPSCTFKIYIVDNASSDGTVEEIHKLFPDVMVLINTNNKGFAAANNIVLNQYQSRYYLLLNPDTEVFPGALQVLIEFADTHPDAWAVGPAVINADGSPQRTGVRFPNNWNIFAESFFLDRVFPYSRLFGSHRELYVEPSLIRNVDYLQGSCLLVKREAIKRIGTLDESYFMYFEETDWCYRMKQAGGKIYYMPHAVIKHYGGGEKAHYDAWKIRHYHQSLLRFYKKFRNLEQSIVLRSILLIRSFTRAIVWSFVLIFSAGINKKAISTCTGYIKLVPILFSKVS